MRAPCRFASATASITRAVPATLICHMRSTSSTPVCSGSITNARCTTARTSNSRISFTSCRQESSVPISIGSKCRRAAPSTGGRISAPITRWLPSKGTNLIPRFPATPVTRTCWGCSVIGSLRLRCRRRQLRLRRFRTEIGVIQLGLHALYQRLHRGLRALTLELVLDLFLHALQWHQPRFFNFINVIGLAIFQYRRNATGLQLDDLLLVPGIHAATLLP